MARLDRVDPSGTWALRRKAEKELRRRFKKLRRKVRKLIVEDDVFGTRGRPFALNTRWEFKNSREQLEAFETWLRVQVATEVLEKQRVAPVREDVRRLQRDDFTDFLAEVKEVEDLLKDEEDIDLGDLTEDITRKADDAVTKAAHAVAQIRRKLLEKAGRLRDNHWLQGYINTVYQDGMAKTFDRLNKSKAEKEVQSKVASEVGKTLDWYRGTKEEFIRSSFLKPVSVGRVRIMASRTLSGLEGVTEQMTQGVMRELVDGMIRGDSPRTVAAAMGKSMDMALPKALRLARTETIRAHNEGALDSMEALGIEEVGVMVEWSTTGDLRVCPMCRALSKVVLKTKEAHNLLPRHPDCRCSFIPANVGEDKTGQIRTAPRIRKAMLASIKAEVSGRSRGGRKRTLKQRVDRSRWAGADKKDSISKKRPVSILDGGA